MAYVEYPLAPGSTGPAVHHSTSSSTLEAPGTDYQQFGYGETLTISGTPMFGAQVLARQEENLWTLDAFYKAKPRADY